MDKRLLPRLLPFLSAILFCFFQTKTFAQFSYYDDDQLLSVELGVGGASYYGDLTEKASLLKNAGLAYTLGLSYSATIQFRPMLTASWMRISGDDKNNSREALKNRNLNFESNVLDVNLGLRYHILPPSVSMISPYVYGGVGIFHFNPYTTDRSGTKRFLQPLGTEGQRLPNASQAPYKLTQFQVPFGGGLNLILSKQINIALDATFRKTFTDYLDDVSTIYVNRSQLSQLNPILPSLSFRGDEINAGAGYPSVTLPRGNPKRKDLYYTVGLKIIYQFSNSE